MILKPWNEYILKNWLSENHGQRFAPEYRVKGLLDRCGTLLLRDVPQEERDTLTSYKEMVVGRREISVSSCPAAIADMYISGDVDLTKLKPDDRLDYEMLTERLALPEKRSAQPRTNTKFDRLQKLKTSYPYCVLTSARVDTDGCFWFMGQGYQIDPDYEKYAPRKTRYGMQYDMDRVLILHDGSDAILFLAQDGIAIPDDKITLTEATKNDR